MKRTLLTLLACTVLIATAAGQSSFNVFSIPRDGDHGWLGVSVQDVTKKLADKKNLKVSTGAYVTEVIEESPAEKAGILDGDVIVRLDSKEIDDGDDLIRAVGRSEPGDEVAVVVDRDGKSITVNAKLSEMEGPQAYSFTIPPGVPSTPRREPLHGQPFGMGFFRSGERLGMEMQTLSKQLADYFEVPGRRGVLVSSVAAKSAAEKAGMKAGDIIVEVNRNAVRDIDDVVEEIRDNPGTDVPFALIRKGKPMTVSVTVDRADEDEDDTSLFDEWRDEGGSRSRRRIEFHLKKDALRELGETIRDLKESIRNNIGHNLRDEIRDNILRLKESLRVELRRI